MGDSNLVFRIKMMLFIHLFIFWKRKEKITRHASSDTKHTEHSVSLLFGSQAGSK